MTADQIAHIFNQTFRTPYHTLVEIGADEPFYQAPIFEAGECIQEGKLHTREDYPSSVLHEIAHWCIAGEQRRRLDDFGYWYAPDGRNAEQQKAFEKLEIRPQAVEAYFHRCLGMTFHVSVDNLEGEIDPTSDFANKVETLFQQFINDPRSLPPRAYQLGEAFSLAVN